MEKMESLKCQIENFKNEIINQLSLFEEVYIVPHNRMDFDALASSVALAELFNQLGKKSSIITDDKEFYMLDNIRQMYINLSNQYNFIYSSEFCITQNELVMFVDTNKKSLIPIEPFLPFLNKIAIIDHHNVDNDSITCDYGLINSNISSTSELMFWLLDAFGVKINRYLAYCLLSGIYLDTDLLSRNFSYSTAKTVSQLLKLGVSNDSVRNLFIISDFKKDREEQRLINHLIDNTKFITFNGIKLGITMNRFNSNIVYRHDILAKAADYLLKYDIDAAFVIGMVDLACIGENHDDIVAIKARSKNIDVSKVMNYFGGGGNNLSAACMINCSDAFAIEEALTNVLAITENLMTSGDDILPMVKQINK